MKTVVHTLMLATLLSGAVAGRKERQLVVKNCLRNRGYSVLN